jgi:hypothetical protein
MARGARSTPLKPRAGGGLASARSKTGSPECSQAMSLWVRGRKTGAVAAAVFQMLAKCRAMARGRKLSRDHDLAGNTAKSQVWARRAERGLSGKARLDLAAKLRADRTSKANSKGAVGTPIAAKEAPGRPPIEDLPATVRGPRAEKPQEPGGFSLARQSAHAKKATTFGDTGGATGTMFDMKRGDKPGQTSIFDKVKAEHTGQAARPFHAQVAAAAHAVPREKHAYADSKVWIHHVHEEHQRDIRNPRMTLAEFKQALTSDEMRPRGMLGGADLVGGFDQADLRRSETRHGPAQFNFVRLPKAGRSTVHLAPAAATARAQEIRPIHPVPEDVARHGRERLERRRRTAEKLSKFRALKNEHEHPELHGKPDTPYELDTKHIHFDPDRFQYKLGAQGQHGVTEALGDVKAWNPKLAGIVSVWRDPKDGKTYVVNGHHRIDLAKKLDVGRVKVQYLDSPDATSARAEGALVNIAEGRGTPVDAAKFFRDAGFTPEQAKAEGVSLKEHTARQGLAMSHLDDRIFRRVVDGEMTPNRAAIVGGSGLSHEQQRSLVRILDQPKNRNLTDGTVKNLVDMTKAAGSKKVVTHDLFGANEEEQSLAIHRATLEDKIKRKLGEDKRLFGLVSRSKSAAALAERGNSSIDVESTGKVGQEAAAVHAVFDTHKHLAGALSHSLNEGAERIHSGDRMEKVVNEHYKHAVRHIKRILEGPAAAFE